MFIINILCTIVVAISTYKEYNNKKGVECCEYVAECKSYIAHLGGKVQLLFLFVLNPNILHVK